MQLQAEEVMCLNVICEEAREVRSGIDGYLRVIPIVGGSVEGRVRGSVVSGGADWNTEKPNGDAHVFAKYMLETDDGEYIAVENEGILEKDSTARIKTVLRFTADENGKYAWLNKGVYVGSLEGGKVPNSVEIHVYRIG